MSCNHDCSSCTEKCDKSQFMATPKETTKIGKMIAVVSGKGGVGKSMVTDLLAVGTLRKGYRVAVLDADITGPSIPKMYGLKGPAASDGNGIYPPVAGNGQ